MTEIKLKTLIPKTTIFNSTIAKNKPKKAEIKKSNDQKIHNISNELKLDNKEGISIPKLTIYNENSISKLTIATNDQIESFVKKAVAKSYTKTPDISNETRHDLNNRLQKDSYNGEDIVVIAFEGTGAFNPRLAPIMQDVANSLKESNLTLNGSNESIYNKVVSGIEDKKGKDINWSGLATGPLESLLEDDSLQGKVKWLSFPSEEIEILSSKEAYQKTSVKEIIKESIGSYNGSTPGINDAFDKVNEIRKEAKKQGKNPKFVIISHSSGGRSAIKFLEKAKSIKDEGKSIKFPLVMTIDPVREAHEAVAEASREVINKGTEHNANRLRSVVDSIPFVEVKQKKVYPPTIGYQSQPKSLYKTSNSEKFISFYQRNDLEGLKMSPKFGIHGSPVKGAQNIQIKGLSESGHGEIAYNEKVLNSFINNLKSISNK